MRRQNKIRQNEWGLVSFIVTMVMMLVISLVVIGFARLTRREQRQALDRQLSTQAYYAAETGINDAVKALKDTPGLATSDYISNCDQFTTAASLSGVIDASASISYSCLLVDPSPPSLEYGNIDTNTSKVVPINSSTGANISTLNISWQDKSGGTNLSGCGSATPTSLPTASAWNCDTGIMRVDLTPAIRPAGSLDRDYLLDNTVTLFLYPSSSAGAATSAAFGSHIGLGNQGNILGVRCNSAPGPKQCNFSITGLSLNSYILRVKSIYRASSANISATDGASAILQLKDAQALIDATGKATDVLRRVQVRLPVSNYDNRYAEFALQSVDDLCKRFEVAPPSYYVPDTTQSSACDVLN